MLTLPIRSSGNLIIAGDDSEAQSFVATAQPRVARDPSGAPRFRFVTWSADGRSASDGLAAVGGRLDLDLEIGPSERELSAAGIAPDAWRPLPWLDSTVRVQGPGLESIGMETSLVGGTRAVAVADVSAQHAGVLARILAESGAAALQATWSGHVQVRLPAIEVVATADQEETRRVLATASGNRRLIRTTLEANARVEISGADAPELEASLREWALEELADRIENGGELLVRASAAEVTRWPIRLEGTLGELVPQEERSSLVTRLELSSEELGSTAPVDVRVVGPFDRELERVDVHLERLDGAGAAVHLSLTSEEVQSAGLGSHSYRWKRRVKLSDNAPDAWSEWVERRGHSSLTLPVHVEPTLVLQVASTGLDFAQRWKSVELKLEQVSEGAGTTASHSMRLDAEHPSAHWRVPPSREASRLRARVTYLSLDGMAVEQFLEEVPGDQLLLPDPFDLNRLRIALVPTGNGWPEVARVMVDLRYRDGDVLHEETLPLSDIDDFVEWDVPARPAGPQQIEARWHTCFTDGRFESCEWRMVEPPVATIHIEGTALRELRIFPIHFDGNRSSAAQVRVSSGGESKSLDLLDASPKSLVLPAGPYEWSVTWTLATGGTVAVDQTTSNDDVLVVPPLPAGGLS